jgi:hypothetical protein
VRGDWRPGRLRYCSLCISDLADGSSLCSWLTAVPSYWDPTMPEERGFSLSATRLNYSRGFLLQNFSPNNRQTFVTSAARLSAHQQTALHDPSLFRIVQPQIATSSSPVQPQTATIPSICPPTAMIPSFLATNRNDSVGVQQQNEKKKEEKGNDGVAY